MADLNFDLVVIGAGPGGYVGAIRAAQLGFKTAVIEKENLGGTCLNVGCIPSKALLESSEHYAAALHDLADHGVKIGSVDLDLKTMMTRKEKIVKGLTGGVGFLFKKHKIESFKGTGKLLDPHSVEVTSTDGQKQTLQAKNIMLATGSTPIELPFLKFNEKNVVSSTGALSLTQVPKTLIVVGGGYIGLEMGSVWMRLGAQVTVVEFADKICGTMDQQISKQLQTILAKQGMKFLLKTKVVSSDIQSGGVKLQCEDLSTQEKLNLEADVVLVAAGRKAYSEGLGLETVGVAKDAQGRVLVNNHYQTNLPHIYAIGDLIAGPMLAHKAEEEGVAVAELMAGLPGHVNYFTVPGVIYTWPEVASVGYTEEQCKEQGLEYNVGSCPFMANARARALGNTDGQVKIIADKKTDRLLGVHILGPRASEMIAEAVVAMEFGGSAEDLARSFHAHPTLSEVMREAALAVDKRARQF